MMVRKSFKTCGISNALDSTKDDEVYTDDMPELADDYMMVEDEFETDSEDAWLKTAFVKSPLKTKQQLIFVCKLPVICVCW